MDSNIVIAVLALIGSTLAGTGGIWLGALLKTRWFNQIAEQRVADRGLAAQLEGWKTFTTELQQRIAALEALDAIRRKRILEIEEAYSHCEERNRALGERVRVLERRLGLESPQ